MSSSGEAVATTTRTKHAAVRPTGALWAVGLPARALLLGLLHLYRTFLSPLFPARCRFQPSCSAYAVEAIRVHGAVKGLVLGARRLLRCSPATAGGSDPVPPARYEGVIQSDGGRA